MNKQEVPSVIEQVNEFMSSTRYNQYVDDGILRIYIRKGTHCVGGEIIETFDVANIQPIRPIYRGQGYFKSFMLHVETLGLPVRVESIMNPTLIAMLEKHGYEIERPTDWYANAIKNVPS